jgi:hypothetical protein
VSDSDYHFDNKDAVDHIRGVAPTDVVDRVRSHLDRGCSQCHRNYKFWSLFKELAARELAYEPPQAAVHFVKAAFSIPHGVRSRGPGAIARLIFDSLRAPLPSGVRGVSAANRVRWLLYQTRDLLIHIQMEIGSGTRIFLTGQALSRKASQPTAAVGAKVELMDRDERRIATTTGNSDGEFRLEFDDQTGLCLHLETGKESVVLLPAPDAPGA